LTLHPKLLIVNPNSRLLTTIRTPCNINRLPYSEGAELDKMLTHIVAMKREWEENSVMN